jgi:hypothetical protein
MFRVFSAPIIRSTIKTADAIIGTIHVSVWFKFVESCPRSEVYFTMSWPIKTADAIIGTVHVSVWFKSVESCPMSEVYFTMSWPMAMT